VRLRKNVLNPAYLEYEIDGSKFGAGRRGGAGESLLQQPQEVRDKEPARAATAAKIERISFFIIVVKLRVFLP